MANHKSSEKRARQTIKRTERNRFYRTRLKNITKAVRVAVEAGDKEAALNALKKQTASRRVGRLAKLVNKLSA